MGLSCECPEWDGESGWAYFEPEDFKTLDTKRGRRCSSCKKLIKVGNECLEFPRERAPRNEIEERIHGDTVDMSPLYMCSDCGEIWLNLNALDYCISPEDSMADCLAEYHRLTGFDPSKYAAG